MATTAPLPLNIFIIGAQCTGKTTIVRALEKHFSEQKLLQPVVISEVARRVIQETKIYRQDIRSSLERSLALQKAILQAQHKAEYAAAEKWYISDRSGVDPVSASGDKWINPGSDSHAKTCSGRLRIALRG
jgi:predicted ATPase